MNSQPINLMSLAVPKNELFTFSAGVLDAETLQSAIIGRYDHAPVLDENEQLLGLISVSSAKERFDAGVPISKTDHDIHDRSVPAFIDILDLLDELLIQPAVVVDEDDAGGRHHWFGIITISDLNRHPFRSYLYPYLAELESSLAELIDGFYQDPRDWILMSSEDSQVRHFGQWQVTREKGVETSPIIGCTLMDMINIVAKTPALFNELDFSSRRSFESATGSLKEFRNQIMHPVRPLILGADDLKKLRNAIGTAIDITRRVVASVPITTV